MIFCRKIFWKIFRNRVGRLSRKGYTCAQETSQHSTRKPFLTPLLREDGILYKCFEGKH